MTLPCNLLDPETKMFFIHRIYTYNSMKVAWVKKGEKHTMLMFIGIIT